MQSENDIKSSTAKSLIARILGKIRGIIRQNSRQIVAFSAVALLVTSARLFLFDRANPNLLSIEISYSARDDEFQAFFDSGKGFSEADSVTASVESDKQSQTIVFRLPAGRIKALRIDPGNGDNEFLISKVTYNSATFRAKQLAQLLRPAQDIASFYAEKDLVHIQTTGNDPIFLFVADLSKYPASANELPFIAWTVVILVIVSVLMARFANLKWLVDRAWLKNGIAVALSLVVFFQCAYQFFSISKNVDTIAMVDSGDWDAARGIEASMRSGWLNDNGWIYYGNFYYRLANSLEKLDPNRKDNANKADDVERSYHFALMALSLLSMLGIVALISLVIGKSTIERLLCFIILNVAFMTNYTWTLWVFRVHPDLLLSLLTCVAIYFSITYMRWNRNIDFALAALFWGMAMATKLSTLMFLPALLGLFFLPFNKQSFLKAPIFFLAIFAVYFIVGFPQNFRISESISFLGNVTGSEKGLTFGQIRNAILAIKGEAMPMLALVVLLSVVMGGKQRIVKGTDFIRTSIMIAFPMVYLVCSNFVILLDHYYLPIVASLLFLIATFATSIISIMYRKLPIAISETLRRLRSIALVAVLALLPFFLAYPSFTTQRVLGDLGVGGFRVTAWEVYKTIEIFQIQNYLVYVDPYVPYNRRIGNIVYSDSPTQAKIDLSKVDVLVFNTNYDKRFAADSGTIEWERTRSDWTEVRRFYRYFVSKQPYVDWLGQEWSISRQFQNGLWVIWQKEASRIVKDGSR